MKRSLPLALLLLPFVVAACQDENPLSHGVSYTGVWETAGFEGIVFLFELEEVGDSLAGNFFVEDATGALSDPAPLTAGVVAGEEIYFTFDFAGAMVDSIPIDTISYHGTRETDDVLRMEQYICFGDTCITTPFSAIRQSTGF